MKWELNVSINYIMVNSKCVIHLLAFTDETVESELAG